MTFFVGSGGRVKLRRKSSTGFTSSILAADINTSLNRFGVDEAVENLLTGDQVEIKTTDARGLDFLPTSTWPDGGGTTQQSIVAFANVNAIGGIRLFPTFADSVNNTRANEYPLEAFTGSPILVDIKTYGAVERVLGDVTGFSFNTDREAIDVTTICDNKSFKRMYGAGLISGSGSIDCLFSTTVNGIQENSLLLLQLINRAKLGGEFSCFLQLTDSTIYPNAQNLYYEFDAVITRSGVEVRGDQLISCAIDFVTTGEIKIVIGEPSGYVLKEDDDKIQLQQNLDFLLTEATD